LKKLDITVARDRAMLRTKMKGRGLVPKTAREIVFTVNGNQQTDVEVSLTSTCPSRNYFHLAFDT
jgi:hypothetical protein